MKAIIKKIKEKKSRKGKERKGTVSQRGGEQIGRTGPSEGVP